MWRSLLGFLKFLAGGLAVLVLLAALAIGWVVYGRSHLLPYLAPGMEADFFKSYFPSAIGLGDRVRIYDGGDNIMGPDCGSAIFRLDAVTVAGLHARGLDLLADARRAERLPQLGIFTAGSKGETVAYRAWKPTPVPDKELVYYTNISDEHGRRLPPANLPSANTFLGGIECYQLRPDPDKGNVALLQRIVRSPGSYYTMRDGRLGLIVAPEEGLAIVLWHGT
ncbi:MAG: hypothetical protein WDN72_01105 [Alphaproteobacteria bacterium]